MPSLSTKAIRSISSTLCDIDASQVTDAALSKKKSQVAPVGTGSQKKKDASSKKDAATSSKNDDAPQVRRMVLLISKDCPPRGAWKKWADRMAFCL